MKYHNPALPITIDRSAHANDPATLSIHYGSADTRPTSDLSTAQDSDAPDSDSTETIKTIEMKNRTNSEILAELQRVTEAYPVEPTPEDLEEMRQLEEQRIRSQADSKLAKQVKAKQLREKRMLEQARGEIAAQADS